MGSPMEKMCSVCPKSFIRQADLRRHMKIHDPEGEKLKLPCPYEGCNYKAHQLSNLNTHLNTHTGERPHKCPEDGCDFSTGDPGSLTRHRSRKHRYDPKIKSEARKQARRQRGIASYSSSSPNSTGRSSGSELPLDPSLQLSQAGAPVPEIPCILDQDPSLSRVGSSSVNRQKAKHIFAAYSTELIPKYPQANDSFVEPNAQTQESLPLPSGLMTRTEPSVGGSSQLSLLVQAQQRYLSTFNPLAEPLLPEVVPQTSIGTPNALLADFLSPFDRLHGNEAPTPSYIPVTMQHAVCNPPARNLASLPSYYGVQPHSINDSTYFSNLPTDEYNGYPNEAESLNTQISHPSLFFTSNASSVYIQPLYQAHNFYPTPMPEMNGWPVQEPYL